MSTDIDLSVAHGSEAAPRNAGGGGARRGERLLLLSSSTLFGRRYLDHAADAIRDLLGSSRRVLFLPYALHDREAYAERTRECLRQLGYAVDSAAETADPKGAVRRAEAIFVGGGNTFRLLEALYRLGLMKPVRARVARGVPYIGSSAGSIVACPSIGTTKDMPIVEPSSFRALGLIDFQISPHYLDPDPQSTHMGETQEERIRQFHEENEPPVVGLREGAMLHVENGSVVLEGIAGARVFRRGRGPIEAEPVRHLDDLLAGADP
jgi:dipeptidase E